MRMKPFRHCIWATMQKPLRSFSITTTRTYMFGLKKEDGKNIFLINTGTDDIEANAMKVLEAEKKIAW